MGNILGSENLGIMGPKFLASSAELYYVQRMPSDRDRSARVGGSNQVLEKDTLGFANRLAAHRAIAKTRRAVLASTPMAARDEGHNGRLFQANHAFRGFEHFCRKSRLQHGVNLSHGGPVLRALAPAFLHDFVHVVGAIIWFR